MIENLQIDSLDNQKKIKHIEKRIEKIQQQYFDETLTKANQEAVLKNYENIGYDNLSDVEKMAKNETEQNLKITTEKISMMKHTFNSLSKEYKSMYKNHSEKINKD